jgi:hypothetical protein
MRRAQLRLRQVATIVAVALFVAVATVTGLPRPHATELVARAAAQQGPIQRLPPSGRRWY